VKEKEQFWNDIGKYIDQRDHSLLILNFPLPTEDILRKVNLQPYEHSIVNVLSHLVTITQKSKKILLEKGIVSMPERDVYKCFPGEYTDKVEKRWMNIGRAISFESKLWSIDERTIRIIKGILKTMGEDPHLATQKIMEDDAEFLYEAGGEEIPIFKHLDKPDLEVIFSRCSGFDLFKAAFYHFLNCRKTPLAVRGEDESVFLTEAPTFAYFIFKKCRITPKEEIRSGQGAAIITPLLDETDMGILIGRLSQTSIRIEFGKPRNVVQKTLMRRLVGGKGPKGRVYHSIKEKYPDLEVMHEHTFSTEKRIIYTPRNAFENVIDTLKETGTQFRIVA